MSYEALYNAPEAKKKPDLSWERYINPTDPNDHTPERYRYSVDQMYGDVLDVGAGDGFGAHLMKQNENIDSITCVEIQDSSLKKLEKNVPGVTIIKDVAERMVLNKQFDSVHCGHTLEHVEDLDGALEGIKRHAKDKVIISVPINGGLSHIHLREFKTIEEVRGVLSKYFEVISHRLFTKNNTVSSVVFINKN